MFCLFKDYGCGFHENIWITCFIKAWTVLFIMILVFINVFVKRCVYENDMFMKSYVLWFLWKDECYECWCMKNDVYKDYDDFSWMLWMINVYDVLGV